MRATGTLLLAAGFVSLAISRLIEGPAALDANIGAGILTIGGFALGGIGLLLLAGALLRAITAAHRNRSAS